MVTTPLVAVKAIPRNGRGLKGHWTIFLNKGLEANNLILLRPNIVPGLKIGFTFSNP